MHHNGVNCVLADELGLGQTLQWLTLLAFLKHERLQTGPHLLVVTAPSLAASRHVHELASHTPDLKIALVEGTRDDQAALLTRLAAGTSDAFDVLVTTRQDALVHTEALMAFAWHAVVLDVDAPADAMSTLEELRRLRSRFVLLVTPVPRVDDGEHTSTAGEPRSLARSLLPSQSRRRIGADLIDQQMAPLREITLKVGMSDEQRESYRQILAQFRNATANNAPVSYSTALSTLMHMRIVCNHPRTLTGSPLGLAERSAKVWALAELMRRLHRRGSRMVIAAQMTRTLDALGHFLHQCGYVTRRIDGSTPAVDRLSASADFNAADSQVFALLTSARTGSLGIDLTGADTVVIYDPEINRVSERLLIDKVNRRGQAKLVTVVRLITAGSVEEKIVQLAHQAGSDPDPSQLATRLMSKSTESTNLVVSIINYQASACLDSTITNAAVESELQHHFPIARW